MSTVRDVLALYHACVPFGTAIGDCLDVYLECDQVTEQKKDEILTLEELSNLALIDDAIASFVPEKNESMVLEYTLGELYTTRAVLLLFQWKRLDQLAQKANGKVILLESCVYFQMASELENATNHLWINWGDTITLLAELYDIPPLLEQAVEKYGKGEVANPASIQCKLKFASSLSRCASSRFFLDYEYNESLFERSELKFIEVEALLEQIDTNTSNTDRKPCIEPKSRSFLLKTQNNSMTEVREAEDGSRMTITKMEILPAYNSLDIHIVESNLGGKIEIAKDKLFIAWGKSLERHALVQMKRGILPFAISLYLHAAELYSEIHSSKVEEARGAKFMGKVLDTISTIAGIDTASSLSITRVTKLYLNHILHVVKEEGMNMSLKPLISLILSQHFAIVQANPLVALQEISNQCQGEVKEEAIASLASLEPLLDMNQLGISYRYIRIHTIDDVELGMAHLPPSAKKLFQKSGLAYNTVKDDTKLILNLLLFLTKRKEWPEALVSTIQYSHFCGLSALNPSIAYIEKNPENYYMHHTSIGSGAFSKVFMAQIRGIVPASFAALKVFVQPYSQASHQIDHEIKLYQYLAHRCIVPYVESYKWKDRVCTVLDFCDGGSLEDFIKSAGFISEDQISYFAQEILLGVQHIHAHHFIHRDLKPANILLYMNGNVAIGDLGLGISIQGEEIKALPRVGTCHWMAPELILGLPYGYASDIWSFGCIIYELVYGHFPYHNFSNLKAMISVTKLGIELPPKGRNKEPISAKLMDFMSQCFEMNSRARPSASSLLQHPFMELGSKPDSSLFSKLEAVFLSSSLFNSGLL